MVQTPEQTYWNTLTNDAPTQAKIWLEGFDIEKSNLPASYQINLITLPQETDLYTLHCAWGLLINRFATSNDILYGTGGLGLNYYPVRSKPETEETLGTFLLKQTNQLKISEKEINSLHAEGTGSLFRYLFMTHADLKLNADQIKIDSEQYPLILIASYENPKQFLLCHNLKKFTSLSQKSIVDHLLVILDKIHTEPDQSVTQFSILTDEDKEKLDGWCQPYLAHSDIIHKKNFVHDRFSLHAQKFPTHPAIIWNNTTVSYGELEQHANQIAHFLIHKNIHPDDKIAVFMERTPALIAVMLGIYKVGAVFVPINPKYPDDRIQFILDDCQARLILVNHTQRIPKEALFKTEIIDENFSEIKHFPTQLPSSVKENHIDQVAYIVYTSGTTGQPKGVMILHVSLMNLVDWYEMCFQISAHDRASQFNSLGFDAFFCEVVPILCVGGSLHLIDDHVKLTPILFFNWITEQKITICDMPTAYAQVLFNSRWPDQSSLRVLKIGGESLTQYPKQSLTFDVWNIYGPTEATIEATFYKIVEAHTPPEAQPSQHLPPPIGKPIPNTSCYIVDSHLTLVPPGCAGELLIGGIGLSPGYLNCPQLTRDKFIRNIFSENTQDKLYRTGDLVRWLSDGNLEFLGRVDHQIKIRGYRIELNEIEAALSHHSDVGEVIVLAKERPNGEKSLVAWLVPNLENIRIPWQERCLVSIDGSEYVQVFTEDYSRAGIAINGYSEKLEPSQKIQINVKLPGTSDAQWLVGKVIWQQERRAGIYLDQTPKQKNILQKSVEYYLSTHNLMETLQSAAAKRNLRRALKKKLPEYMIPSSFSILPRMPLTFNGKIDWKSLPPPQDFERLLERKHVEPRTKTEREIAEIWCKVLGEDQVSITDNFFDLGGNSLSVSKILVELMDKFHISIPAKIFLDLPFIPVMAEFIDSKGQHYTTKSAIQDEIFRDAILNDDIIPHKIMSTTLKNPQHILLTGAGGFLGLFILRELIIHTKAKIYCLIRQGDFDSIAARMNAQIEHFGLSHDLSLTNRRIVLITGDIGSHQFGIPSELYEMLTHKVDCIYHCGAQVNTMASYTTVRTSNVQGTIEVIRFSVQQFDKPIFYISTLSAAFEKNQEGHYAEVFPGSQTDQLSGGYAISKWVSERLLTQLMHRGLPVQIYRSGYIGGTSDLGITNQNDALLLLIKGCIQLGFAPDWQEIIALLPVDFVSQAIVKISLEHPDKSGVYHLDHPIGILWTDLVEWLVEYGYPIKLCTHHEWINHLMHIDHANVLFPFLPHYLSMKEEPKTPLTSIENTKKTLTTLGIQYPEINDAFLTIMINYLENSRFLPPREPVKSESI